MNEYSAEWTARIFIEEQDEDVTRARVNLRTRDTELVGTGTARRNPRDPSVPEIGDELAVARALSDVAHQLLDAAAADIEAVTVHAGR
jgi:hypothetical protein